MFRKSFPLKSFERIFRQTHHFCNRRVTSFYLIKYSSFATMPTSTKRGAFIVFEGCDKSGKTTQCKKLVESLQSDGENVQFCRFPERDTAIGKVISDYLEKKCELEDHAVHLLFAANRWEAVPKMKELLNKGTTLIVDRYSYSGVAFTAAKQGLDVQWCKQPEIGLPKPDAVLYLTVSADEAAKRGSYGEERYEETDFQKNVANNYSLLKEDNWRQIDASKSIEELHKEVKKIVLTIMTDSKNKELGTLWTDDKKSLTKDNLESGDAAEPVTKKIRSETVEPTDVSV